MIYTQQIFSPYLLVTLFKLASTSNMSYMLPHLHNGWQVDQAILSEEDRVIVFRFVKIINCFSLNPLHKTAMQVWLIPASSWTRSQPRFGHDWDPTCMKMDETLYGIAEKIRNFAQVYLVDITEVPDFNKMYELYDPCTVMFFYRNKHIMIDLGTGKCSLFIGEPWTSD